NFQATSLDDWRSGVRAGGVCGCVSMVDAHKESGRADGVWKSGAVPGATGGERRIAGERRDAALAAQPVLDAAGDELHAVDDRAIRVDVLRGVQAPGDAEPVSRRHGVFPAWHSTDCGFSTAAASDARGRADAVRVSGFCVADYVVDVSVRVHGAALGVRVAERRRVQ